MTISEFSNEFDVLVDSYRRFKNFDDRLILDSIEFSEYEKSVFLTIALINTVLLLYLGAYTQLPFETTENARRDLETLVRESYLSTEESEFIKDKLKHKIFKLPEDCLYIIFELGIFEEDDKCINGTSADVLPVKHDEYTRLIRNPFRGPNKNRILRLDKGLNLLEIVSSFNVGSYFIRYIKRPLPIVLCDLRPDDINIEGVLIPLGSELPKHIHKNILQLAVSLALRTKTTSEKQEDK